MINPSVSGSHPSFPYGCEPVFSCEKKPPTGGFADESVF
ncbi:hypothetical protein A943_21065 [Bacillus sp. CPSM8]|nr:hypothetical protein A943_21065 [Bacillus sp. CPSM8]KUL07800.1 hypothetical protein LI7559_18130 [Bacillus licheniformis LMG 7559]